MNEKGFRMQIWLYILVIVIGLSFIWLRSYGAQAPRLKKSRAAKVYAVIPDKPSVIRQPSFDLNKHSTRRAKMIAKLKARGLRVIDGHPVRKQIDAAKLRQHKSVGVKIKKAKVRNK